MQGYCNQDCHCWRDGQGRGTKFQCGVCKKYTAKDFMDTIESPTILVFDIETLPMNSLHWRTYKENIGHDQVLQDWVALSWSAKWLKSDRTISDVLTTKEATTRQDKRICESLWKLFDDADIIISHNGKDFDHKKMNWRFIKNRLTPPSSFKIIDTCEASKKVFGASYNSLDALADELGLGRKKKTEFDLWKKCHFGDKQSLAYMREYNVWDTELLEQVYLKMRPWIPNHPKITSYEKLTQCCPVCLGAEKFIGYYQAPVQKYKEYRCQECGAVYHSSKAEK